MKLSGSHPFAESKRTIFVEPSKVHRLISSTINQSFGERQSSHFAQDPISPSPVDASTIRDLEQQARQSKSISCISALCLTMETLGVQASISRRLLRMARCAYGLNLEVELRTTMRSILGRDGLQEPTRRIKQLGVLPDGRRVMLTGRCDALINSSTEESGVIPVEMKSRTRVDRMENILRAGHISQSFQDEWSSNQSSASSHARNMRTSGSSGSGDATQSLLYMWLYDSDRLLYAQCARVGPTDPLVPLIAEISWDAEAFEATRSAVLNRLAQSSSSRQRPVTKESPSAGSIKSPQQMSSASRKPKQTVVSPETRVRPLHNQKPTPKAPVRQNQNRKRGAGRAYRTRLFRRCGNLLRRAGIPLEGLDCRDRSSVARMGSSIRTRKQKAAFLHAARMYGANRRAVRELLESCA